MTATRPAILSTTPPHLPLHESRITFGFAGGPAGRILIAWTNRGVCRVSLQAGRSEKAIVGELRRSWSGAKLVRDDPRAGRLALKILGALRGERIRSAMALHAPATPFQALVWQELLKVPPGATTTYGRLARAIGRPRAARAVGGAVGQNPLGLIVPCHRVVREDGSLGGFAWGAKQKRALLDYEKQRPGLVATARKTTPTAHKKTRPVSRPGLSRHA